MDAEFGMEALLRSEFLVSVLVLCLATPQVCAALESGVRVSWAQLREAIAAQKLTGKNLMVVLALGGEVRSALRRVERMRSSCRRLGLRRGNGQDRVAARECWAGWRTGWVERNLGAGVDCGYDGCGTFNWVGDRETDATVSDCAEGGEGVIRIM